MQDTLPQSVTPETDMTRILFFVSQFLLKFLVLSLKVFYSILKNSDLFMSIISDQLKVLNSVIKWVSIYVMNYLPSVKTATKTFCHYQPVFFHITFLVRHWIKEVILVNIDRYIRPFSSYFTTSALPTRVLCTTFADMKTLSAPFANRFIVLKCHPTFSPTSWASNPDIFSTLVSFLGGWALVYPFTNFAGSFNLSQYRHNLSYNKQSKMSIGGLRYEEHGNRGLIWLED